ncbi:MAG: hypothetical protein ACKV2U_07150 [Bryobacteraceae bacterium]
MSDPATDAYLGLLAAYEPEIKEVALAVRTLVLEEAPTAAELPFDVMNAVAAGYSFTGKPKDSFVHIAAYSGWVNLGFNKGSEFADPGCILRGEGKWVRHIRISSLSDVERPIVRKFVKEAVRRAKRYVPVVIETKPVVRAISKRRRRPRQR